MNEGVGAANQGGNDRHGTHCEDCLHIAISAACERAACPAQPEAPPGTPPGMASRLAAEPRERGPAGRYNAGDSGTFTLEAYGSGKYLLRFADRGGEFRSRPWSAARWASSC